ncbi:hypothetical protein ABZ953_01765 [Streptomyces sp. NPDC046465]|uniref:hypothetical protein n=1 Tax=Streptomyces sp. NPDC046465 TaxID=3155810 RepID=UPI0033E2540D
MTDSMSRSLSVGSGAFPQSVSAAFDWLARAQQEPQQAHRGWRERGIALLPLGKRFNSVCLPGRIVYAGVGPDDLDVVTRTLAELLRGPVIHNAPQNTYYALVEKGPTARWPYPDEAPMLGGAAWRAPVSLMEKGELVRHEQEVYEILLLHTVECDACRAEEECEEAARVRRALRETRLVLHRAAEPAAANDE